MCRRRLEFPLICNETALNGQVLGFLALALDFLFFCDADALFFFLELVECGAGDFVDGFGYGALEGGFVGGLAGAA